MAHRQFDGGAKSGMAVRFTLRQLEYFVAVCDAGSIAAASERVNVSSPSISTAISQLENVFGLELFVRQRARGLSLTPGGRRFYSAAKDLLDGASALHEVAGEISGEVRAPISVGSLVTVAPFVLPELRTGFQAEVPGCGVPSKSFALSPKGGASHNRRTRHPRSEGSVRTDS